MTDYTHGRQMKAKVLQKDFAKALTTCSRFVSTRAQLPILANILIRTSGAKLTLSATNLELSINTSVGAKVEHEGEIAVPARTITELVSSLQAETIELSTDGEHLKVTTEQFRGSVSGLNTSDFPDIPLSQDKNKLALNTQDFIEALKEVLFATSVDDTRPVLTGVLFIVDKNSLSLVASDGVRLSQKSIRVSGEVPAGKLIIPKNVLSEVVKTLSASPGIEMEYSQDNNQVIFIGEDITMASRVIEGEYPNFERIIPKDSEIECRVSRKDLLSGIKTASVFARDASNVVVLSLNKNGIEISSESQISGQQNSRVDAKVTGDNLTISYNYKYLEDFLNSVGGEEVVMEFTDTTTAGVFRDATEKSLLHLIMPVKG